MRIGQFCVRGYVPNSSIGTVSGSAESLGNRVHALQYFGVDFIQVKMKGSETGTEDVPVKLLDDQAERDEVCQDRLQDLMVDFTLLSADGGERYFDWVFGFGCHGKCSAELPVWDGPMVSYAGFFGCQRITFDRFSTYGKFMAPIRPFLALVALLGPAVAFAQDSTTLAVAHCIGLVRSCSRPDGSLSMTPAPDEPWVNPYFANQAALALLANSSSSDLPKVAAWIQWYAAKALPDGSIDDWSCRNDQNVPVPFHDTGKADSEDSYAAGFLQVCQGYAARTNRIPAGGLFAARKAFDLLYRIPRFHGLTWAKRSYAISYLQDNAEVYGGAVAARLLFTQYHDAVRTARAVSLRDSVAEGLPKFWQPGSSLYASDYNGTSWERGSTLATTGMANLSGYAWISNANQAPFDYVYATYKPDSGAAPQGPVERFYMAALRLPSNSNNDSVKANLKASSVSTGLGFGTNPWYLERPAVTALALLKGADWMPNLVHGDR